MNVLVSLFNSLPGAAGQGLIWGIMAIGVYLTYRILDVADLTVDGSLGTGGAVCVVMVLNGAPVGLALLAATAAGMLAGLVTGLFHTACGIPAILAGILTQLALYSVNLRIMGFGTGGGKVVCGMYGINLDESMGGNEFEYLIADNYNPAREIPEGFTTRTIPAYTWAVFPCTGRMPQALQGLNQQIFSQWLPTNPDYKIAAGINVELYSDASRFEDGTQDQDYYCEVWVPVEKK